MKVSISKRSKSQYQISGDDTSLSPPSVPLKEPKLTHWQVRYMQGIELTKLRKLSKPIKKPESSNFSSTSSLLIQVPSAKPFGKSSTTHFPGSFPSLNTSQHQVPHIKVSIKPSILNTSHFIHSSLLPRHLRPCNSTQVAKSQSSKLLRPRRLSPYQASPVQSSALKDLWTESNASEAFCTSLFIQSQLLGLQAYKPHLNSSNLNNSSQDFASYMKLRKKPVVINKNT